MELLQSANEGVRVVSRAAGVEKSKASKIKMAFETKDEYTLRKVLDGNRLLGARGVITDEEESMVVERCTFAARRGSALDDDDIKNIMSRIAQDERTNEWKKGTRSNDAVRSFRFRHYELAYRWAENKELARLKGEDFDHSKTYETTLRMVEEKCL